MTSAREAGGMELFEVTEADDQWHPASAHWWETETSWFSFNVPERNIGCWLYTLAFVNQGSCNGGVWLWDDSPAGARYERSQAGIPFPDLGDMRHTTFPTGIALDVLEPLRRYRTTYSDPGALELDLVHEAVMAPHPHPLGVWPFWSGHHFDQAMHVTGRVVLHGEVIDVDCHSVRDRSWGPRPRGPVPPDKRLPPEQRPDWARPPDRARRPFATTYLFGTQDEREGFLAFTDPAGEVDGEPCDVVCSGYLLRDGVVAPLVSGQRWITLAPGTRFVDTVHFEATDARGRSLVADGRLRSRHGTQGPIGTAMYEWHWDGHHGFGEDHVLGHGGVYEALAGQRPPDHEPPFTRSP